MNKTCDLKKFIRDIPDFPKAGILFRDITPLLKDPAVFRRAIKDMAGDFKDKKIDVVVAVESRGFIFGSALAYELGVGFVPVRKPGKLPYSTIAATYDLEYGQDSLHMHADALKKGERVLIVDDLLATGGTAQATARLVEQLGAKIAGIVFLIELSALKGRAKLEKYLVKTCLKYE